MRKSIAVIVLGTSLPMLALVPRFGVQSNMAIKTSNIREQHHTDIRLGGHARWDFADGHGGQVHLNLTSREPVLGCSYIYHPEKRQVGLYGLIGLSTSGINFGVGYDLDRHLGFYSGLTSSHKTLNLGVTYTF